jgi:AmiR/NasT family two-component response regulator
MENQLKLSNVNEQLVLVRKDIEMLKAELLRKETDLVGLVKEQRDLKEEIRQYNNSIVIVEITNRDIEIERFRNNYPEEVALAKKRDLDR